MHPIKVLATAMLAVTAFVDNADAHQGPIVSFYEDTNYTGTFMSFPAYWSATCYNIHHCFNDQARSAYWNELNYDLGFHTLGFFDDINCKGESILIGGGSAPGVPNFGHMRVRVSSFATITFGSRIEQYAYFDCSGQSGQSLEPILIRSGHAA